jgi:hypothetical protein
MNTNYASFLRFRVSLSFLCFWILTLSMAACNGAVTPVPLPTVAVPATFTVTVVPETVQATPLPQIRSTLPPTWTPVGGATATLASALQLQMVRATPVVCNAFVIDRSRSVENFRIGEPVTVYWTPIETTARFRVRLFDAELNDLFIDYTQGGQYTFNASLFELGKRYGWEVIPENAASQQMCFAIGGELSPSP